VEQGRAIGVETHNGEFIRARQFVASSLNPHQTFLDLLDDAFVPAEIRDRVNGFQYNLLAPLFALHLNLHEPPNYSASVSCPELKRALMVIMGLDHFDQFGDIVRHHEEGTIPPTVMWGACPTLFDPSQAPPGKHTAFLWEKVPYSLRGDPLTWENEKEGHGRALLELWRQYAPNLNDSNVLDCFVLTPLDTEQTLPNMAMGDLLVGSFAGNQIG
jgi:phytoene dehydrogenase-like protein